MARITLNMKSEKRTAEQISLSDFKTRFLYGIDMKEIPDEVYQFHLDSAYAEFEKFLNIKMKLQLHKETKNYKHTDWTMWGQIRATFPVVCGVSVEGFVGTVRQVTYPKEWISTKKTDEDLYSRLIHIVPSTNAGYHQTAAVYSGLYPNYGWIAGGNNTPNYWTIEYITGFKKKLPADLESAICMLAAINVLTVANETMASALGALGASSKSISLDGLSQSTSMYINGQTGVFSARIKQYTETLLGDGGMKQRLQDYYGAIMWTTA